MRKGFRLVCMARLSGRLTQRGMGANRPDHQKLM
jgi:hypothetical protein